MTADPNSKTLRHFYCRDSLWHSFERMSEDLDRGVDDLVNEAMRIFAREKGYLPTENEGPRPTDGRAPAPPPPPRRAGRPAAAPAAPASLRTSTCSMRPACCRARGRARAVRPRCEQPEVGDVPAPPLYLVFQSQQYLVDKEQFIIGRGLQVVRPAHPRRQHLAQARGGRSAATAPTSSRISGRPTASTTTACASTTSASKRATSSTSATTSCASPTANRSACRAVTSGHVKPELGRAFSPALAGRRPRGWRRSRWRLRVLRSAAGRRALARSWSLFASVPGPSWPAPLPAPTAASRGSRARLRTLAAVLPRSCSGRRW